MTDKKEGISLEVKEHLGVLSEKDTGWKREVNIVAWNGKEPQVDIRWWDKDHEIATKGVVLCEEEARALCEALRKKFEDNE